MKKDHMQTDMCKRIVLKCDFAKFSERKLIKVSQALQVIVMHLEVQ
jgi:hypothetical protein